MSKRILSWVVLVTMVLGLAMSVQAAARRSRSRNRPAKVVTMEQMEAAIAKAKGVLLKRQDPKTGAWADITGGGLDYVKNERQAGVTSLVVYALLSEGMSIKDRPIAKALGWLKKQRVGWTYTLGLRCQVWRLAKREDKVYASWLARDMKALVRASGSRKEWRGAYDYRTLKATRAIPGKKNTDPRLSTRYDNSNSQYGVLGVWAGWASDLKIPSLYWHRTLEHWTKCQQTDGGWVYSGGEGDKNTQTSTPAMTAAGLASMFVCYDAFRASDFLECGKDTENKSIQRGLAWFDANFETSLSIPNDKIPYYLYAVERVGLASGYKYFGTVDWFQHGAEKLLSIRKEDGSWDSWGVDTGTALSMLYLIRGRQPLLFTRLKYDGDWKNRSRAVANLCRWFTLALERDLHWQIVGTNTEPEQWHDAPILVITGQKDPKFTEADLEKLKRFIWQGGTILSIAECDGEDFDKAMKQYYKAILPDCELAELPRTHPLYSIRADLDKRFVFSQATNGVRALAIHSPVDLTKAWQLNQPKVDSEKPYFDAGLSVAMVVTDKSFHSIRGNDWPAPVDSTLALLARRSARVATTKSAISVVRIKHNADPNCEPLAWQRLTRKMVQEDLVEIRLAEALLPIEDLAKQMPSLAVLSGRGVLTLSASERSKLKSYVQEGGALWVDPIGGDAEFATSAKAILTDLFEKTPLTLIDKEDPLLTTKGRMIEKVAYRRAARKRDKGKDCRLELLRLQDNRLGVIYSREGLTEGLLGTMPYRADGYMPKTSFAIGRNVLLELVDVQSAKAKRVRDKLQADRVKEAEARRIEREKVRAETAKRRAEDIAKRDTKRAAKRAAAMEQQKKSSAPK
jgi:hypothetical protein